MSHWKTELSDVCIPEPNFLPLQSIPPLPEDGMAGGSSRIGSDVCLWYVLVFELEERAAVDVVPTVRLRDKDG